MTSLERDGRAATNPPVVTDATELRRMLAGERRAGKSIGLVPTMGALHAGHVSLVEASRRECDYTVVTIFVNPTQFAPHEDFTRYPRTMAADLTALAGLADLVFAPTAERMYQPGHATYVEMQGVAEPLEGLRRPGHFRGVATIVLKLFNLVQPDVAYFGRKDYQQSLVIRHMVSDFDLPITVRVCPIVREPDGLAMSSRNAYLSPADRQQALALNRSLRRAVELVESGQRDAAEIRRQMQEIVAGAANVRLDYLALVDPDTLEEVSRVDRPTVAAVAAFVGSTRLIDNQLLGESL